jgi:hypothetical protein
MIERQLLLLKVCDFYQVVSACASFLRCRIRTSTGLIHAGLSVLWNVRAIHEAVNVNGLTQLSDS